MLPHHRLIDDPEDTIAALEFEIRTLQQTSKLADRGTQRALAGAIAQLERDLDYARWSLEAESNDTLLLIGYCPF